MLDQSRLLPWDRWVLEPPLVMDHVAYLARFWDHVTAKRVFCQNSIFRPKISIVAIIKTKSATAAFSLLLLSFSSLFVFLLSFSFIIAILELFLAPFDAFFNEMTAKMVRLVFKNSARYTQYEMWNFTSLYLIP